VVPGEEALRHAYIHKQDFGWLVAALTGSVSMVLKKPNTANVAA